MCKLFAVVEIENQKNAELFAKRAVPIVTATDNHGLGIMRLGERGVHIQRWLEPPKIVRRKSSKALEKYYDALRHQQNEAGNKSVRLDAIAIHGRFATCARTMSNVHPFYKDGTALMHNGIISNAEKFERTLSTCDSEALLTQYIQHDVKKNPLNLTTALDGVGGYYAAIVFNDNGNIDIFRDESASLYMAHVKGVGVVIATTEEIIVKTAKKCKAFITGMDEILPGVSIRWVQGHSPRISTFESIKPVTILTHGQGSDIIEDHKNSVSDAYKEHWWDLEDIEERGQAKYEKEIAEWEREQELKQLKEEDEEDIQLKKLQGILKETN